MKTRWVVIGMLVSGLLTACGGTTPAPEEGPPEAAIQPASEVQLFNWSEYIDPEIYGLFKDEFGIDVVESNFASNEEMLAKLQGGAAGYDLVVPSDYYVGIMIEEGMLAELDHGVLTNLGNLGDRFRNLPYDPGNKYCIPYQWGTSGIGYNATEKNAPESWSVLFDPDPDATYYKRTTMLDDPREAFAAALVYLGYDINTKDEAQLEQAKQALIRAKAALSGYDSDQYEDLLAAGETVTAHGWNGDILMGQAENENIAYTIPAEGGVVWIDNLCIPQSTPPERKLAAEMFINFLLRPDIGAMISNFTYFATPNQAAEANLDEEFLSDPVVYPPAEVLENLQYIEPLGEFESVYQRMWDEVKASP